MFYCIGNHDLVKGKYGEECFEKYYGPVYYSFDVAGVHYIPCREEITARDIPKTMYAVG